ncbi:MAG: Tol-Pal system protein TolB [Alphaproteobacteria bacterium]|nr:Tol-Pal system protein TolB [Alphaproteobacteria bacterium]
MTEPRRSGSRWRIGARFLLVMLAVAVAGPAAAELKVDITRGNVEPLRIAIPSFAARAPEGTEHGRNVAQVVAADLERSGLFRPVDPRAFIQTEAAAAVQPRFGDWRLINAQALVTGNAEVLADGRLEIAFRLWDVFAEQQLIGFKFATPQSNWRRLAHIIADAIYKRITGEDGYFDTRIVYVSETGAADRRVKRLAMMDQDGANHRFLTNGDNIVLTPRFSPTAQAITYMEFTQRGPRVFLYDIDTGKREVLGDFPGMTFAPRFAPNGNSVVLSQAEDGNSEIYSLDLRTRQARRLTRHPAIDTSPSFSPDGRMIVFNSDRGGAQQLYVMTAAGDDVRRISFGDGRYATPVWSPRGDLIAFTKMRGGQFSIGVMRPDGSGERLLADGFLVEGPTWAPNGRVLMFFRQDRRGGEANGGPQLFSIDLTGFNERRITTPAGASDPAWSPTMP